MATLIPSIGTCVSRMNCSERRLGERLEQKRDADSLLHKGRRQGRRRHANFKFISCSRASEAPLIIRLPTLRNEANKIAELFSKAHQHGCLLWRYGWC